MLPSIAGRYRLMAAGLWNPDPEIRVEAVYLAQFLAERSDSDGMRVSQLLEDYRDSLLGTISYVNEALDDLRRLSWSQKNRTGC